MSWEDGTYWEKEWGDISPQIPNVYNPSCNNPDIRAVPKPDSDDGVILILVIAVILIVCGLIIGYGVTHYRESESESAQSGTLNYDIYTELEAKGGTIVLGSSVSCEVLKEDTLTITSDNYICVHKTGYDTAKGVWKPYNVYVPIDQILYISIKLAS